MIVRSSCPSDYPILRSVMERAFKTPDEAALWDYILASDPALRPEQIRVATEGERPVACTMVLPRLLHTRRGWLPG
ncbi:MAG: hypothetical protein ACM3XM_12870, partial [Mycobacterium leprae]